MLRFYPGFFAALAVAPFATGHSWIEQMRNVNSKGEYVGDYGYPRGYVSQTEPGYNTDTSMNFKLPRPEEGAFISEKTPLCHPGQTTPKQSDKWPRLKTAPGGAIALRYLENGHVTEPVGHMLGKPEKGGTVFVYGTTEPKDDETLFTVIQWTKDGKGGNGKGTLLTMSDFEDSRCYEQNGTPKSQQRQKDHPNYHLGQVSDGPANSPLYCETNVNLPESAPSGKPYTLYWVWQWNTVPGADPGLPTGKDEWYTTCMDVDVVSADVAQAADIAGPNSKYQLGAQDAMSVAVSDFASRTALMTDIVKGEVGPIFSGKPIGSSPASSGSPSKSPESAPVSATAAPVVTGAPAPPPVTGSSTVPGSSRVNPSAPSGQPAIPTITQRPGAVPSQKPDDDVVTVTDTVIITMTASEISGPPSTMVTSKRAVSSAKSQAPPAAGITPPAAKSSLTGVAPSGSAAPSKLPGFDMSNPHGAKFRGMF